VIFIFQQSNTRATRERHSGRAHSLDEYKCDLASGDHGKARSPIVGYLKLPLKTRSKRVLNTIASITFLKHGKCFRPALFCYVSPLPTRLIPAALRAIRDVFVRDANGALWRKVLSEPLQIPPISAVSNDDLLADILVPHCLCPLRHIPKWKPERPRPALGRCCAAGRAVQTSTGSVCVRTEMV
jgi:hypothetical protein